MSESQTSVRERIEVNTSCGAKLNMFVDDLSDAQLSGLIEQNPDKSEATILLAEAERRADERRGRATMQAA